MKTRMIFLITVLAVIFVGTSAIGLAQEVEEETTQPESNTAFVATVDDETDYINYYVCTLNEDADDYCATTLDDFDAATFEDWTGEIAVTVNEEGELNHGSYVSAFAEGYEGEGKGCILRYIAQSDWGTDESVDGAELLIEGETFCAFNSNKPDSSELEVEVEDEDEVAGQGKPEWVGQGKPEGAGSGDDAETDEDAGGPPEWVGAPGKPNSDT
ncbi:MAG: hypothetical protein WEA76_05985 [Acidimicrobiia bacterium]